MGFYYFALRRKGAKKVADNMRVAPYPIASLKFAHMDNVQIALRAGRNILAPLRISAKQILTTVPK